MLFRKLLQGESSWLQYIFAGGTTVKLKQGRPLLNTQLWQVQTVQSMEFGVPLKPSLEMRVSVSFVGLPAGNCGGGFVEGSRICM